MRRLRKLEEMSKRAEWQLFNNKINPNIDFSPIKLTRDLSKEPSKEPHDCERELPRSEMNS